MSALCFLQRTAVNFELVKESPSLLASQRRCEYLWQRKKPGENA